MYYNELKRKCLDDFYNVKKKETVFSCINSVFVTNRKIIFCKNFLTSIVNVS